uniref:Uncharacterized protein n=1 Tax=Arundo donax TaxID=35708 RepID=A0A0A9H6B7_ARUDO
MPWLWPPAHSPA